YLYTNDDGVAETVVLDGVRGATGTLSVAKDSVTLYSIGNNEKFHLAVWLEPREAITVTYTSVSGDTLTMSKNRKSGHASRRIGYGADAGANTNWTPRPTSKRLARRPSRRVGSPRVVVPSNSG